MAEQIILDFSVNTESLTQLAEKMGAIGSLSDDQVEKFKTAGEAMAKAQQAVKKSIEDTARSLEKQSQVLKNISKAIAGNELNEAAGKFEKVSKEAGNMVKVSASLKARLREIKAELQKIGDEGSPRFQKLALQAAKLEDKIKDVDERVRVLASDTFKFDVAVGAVRGLAAAFAAAQSTAALFGEKNENLQRAILKVQAATTALTAVQEIANIITGQGALKVFVMIAAQRTYQTVLALSTRTVQFFGTASAAAWTKATLGLSVLISGIIALVSNWDKVIQKVKEFIGVNKESNDSMEETIDLYDRLAKQKDKRKEQLEHELEVLKLKGAEQMDIIKKEIELARYEIDSNNKRILSNKRLISVYEESEKRTRSLIFHKSKLKEESDKLSKSNELLKAKVEGLSKQLADLSEKAKKAKVDMKTLAKEIEREAEEQFASWTAKFNEQLIKEFEDEDKKKEAQIELQKWMRDIVPEEVIDEPEIPVSLAVRLKIDPEFRKQWEEEQRSAIEQTAIGLGREMSDTLFNIGSERRDRELQDALKKIEAEREAAIKNKDLTESQLAAINEKYRRKEAKIKLEAWKADKAAAISQAMINGLLAITTAIAKLGPPPSPAGVAGIAAAGALTAMSVASIAAKRPPQFRKGTKDAPEGFAIVGEEGPELVYLKKGQKVITAPETKAILERYEIPAIVGYDDFKAGKSAQYLDASEIGKALARELAKNPSLHVKIDSEGFNTYLVSVNQKREILNKKFML
jgi:hypothetical protein